MVYTVTLNPSIDYLVSVEDFEKGTLNRASRESIYPGGKGINVSIVLNNLGIETTALGFISGFTGQEIKRLLSKRGVRNDFIEVDGRSRINIKISDDTETELNGTGPLITARDMDALYGKLDELHTEDILVLAGSVPAGVMETVYMDIAKRLCSKGIRIIVDATGDLLKNAVTCHPFLIKPNDHELGEIYKTDINDFGDALTYAKRLQDDGAQNVLVSMGRKGALLVTTDGEVYKDAAPEGRTVNTVGAGDSMVAGFIAGYLSTMDYRKAFYTALCTGSASAFSDELATRNEVIKLLKAVDIESV